MSEVANLYVTLRAETAPFTRNMRTAATEGESFTTRMGGVGKMMSKLGAATTAVGIGVAAASVKMASDFQTQMTRLQTAAGLTSDKIKAIGLTSDSLNAKVLKIASSVGMSGTQMAEALYHPISAGLDLKSALNVVTESAKEAKISGASLEDTTYSLSSVMKAFNLPAAEARQTMASLNAIVGQGDMRFQDFNASVKNWAPTAAQMGISINSMGAGLAYLTDRGNSAEVAATRMTMGISMMTTPSKQAAKLLEGMGVASSKVSASSKAMTTILQKTGITQNRLATDLKKPDGLYVALKDLQDGLKNAGIKGTEADSVLAKVFGGGRSDKAIMSLLQNLDGVKEKFNDINKASGTKNFDAQWAKTQKTFAVQMQKIKASAENIGISLGLKLIPPLQKLFGFLQQHQGVVKTLAALIGTVLAAAVVKFATGAVVGAVKGISDIAKGLGAAAKAVKAFALSEQVAAMATKIWAGVQAVFNAIMDANPVVLIVIGVVALVAALIYAYKHSERFRAIVQAAFAAVRDAAMQLWHGMQAAWNGIVSGVTWLWHQITTIWNAIVSVTINVWNGITSFFKTWWPLLLVVFATPIAILLGIWNRTHKAIEDTARSVWNGIKSFFGAVWDGIKTVANVVWDGIRAAVITPMKNLAKALQSTWNTLKGWLSSAWGGIRNVASSMWGLIKAAIVNPVSAVVKSVTGYMGKVVSVIKDRLSDAWNTAKGWGSKFVTVGKAIVMGIVHGVVNSAGSLFGSLKSLAGDALSAAKSAIDSKSPSRLFADEVGANITGGIAKGVTDTAGNAHAAVRSVALGMIAETSKTLGIASPSKVFRSLGIYVNEGLVDGLTGSMARVKAATRRIESLLQQTYNRVADLRGTKGVSNKWVNQHEATIRHLEDYARREDKVLRGLAAKRDAVAAKIKTAQKKLTDLQKQWSDEVKSVSSGIMQGFSVVTDAPQEGFALTAQDVVNKMRDQQQKAVQFAAQLAALKKKGLSSDLIAQIAASGVDAGSATATALAGANASQIKQINQANAATKKAANAAGKSVADSMYGSGIKAAQGLVKGLQSQEKAIERQMLKIANAMKKAIKKALGIKSPSTVFAEIGSWIPKGLAKGVDKDSGHAADAIHRMASSVAGAGKFAGAGLAMAGAGSTGTVVNLHVHIEPKGHVLSTNRELRDLVQQEFARLGMRNPQTWAPYKR
ncbi:phage tail tape measure protein [Streptomyces sp. NPDC004237]|uniref:phage tail tape measure protein n=1 Tax=Streptomyces sp. NPDC004237 TaxID=3154455 RepID=UPI0033AEDED7